MLTVTIDGAQYTADNLTFREQREVRSYVRELTGDPAADIGEAALMDFLPALVCVIRRRSDPAFTLEQALDIQMSDVLKDEDEDVPERPTKPAAKRRTR